MTHAADSPAVPPASVLSPPSSPPALAHAFPPAFPPSWNLHPRESALLALLMADRVVPHAELEGVVARYRRGPKGRPLKVHLHYLRAKLAPYGVRIASVYREGFHLTAESRAVLAPYGARDTTAGAAAAVQAA